MTAAGAGTAAAAETQQQQARILEATHPVVTWHAHEAVEAATHPVVTWHAHEEAVEEVGGDGRVHVEVEHAQQLHLHGDHVVVRVRVVR